MDASAALNKLLDDMNAERDRKIAEAFGGDLGQGEGSPFSADVYGSTGYLGGRIGYDKNGLSAGVSGGFADNGNRYQRPPVSVDFGARGPFLGGTAGVTKTVYPGGYSDLGIDYNRSMFGGQLGMGVNQGSDGAYRGNITYKKQW